MKIILIGTEALSNALRQKSEIQWERVCRKSLASIFNRAVTRSTPVSKGKEAGKLRQSVSMQNPSGVLASSGEVGYSVDYAPHVEYGHRTVNGGYVDGQKYLSGNVDEEREAFYENMLRALRED